MEGNRRRHPGSGEVRGDGRRLCPECRPAHDRLEGFEVQLAELLEQKRDARAPSKKQADAARDVAHFTRKVAENQRKEDEALARIAKDTALVAEVRGFRTGQSEKLERAKAELAEAEEEEAAADEQVANKGNGVEVAASVPELSSIVVGVAARVGGVSGECVEAIWREINRAKAALEDAAGAPGGAGEERQAGAAAGITRSPVSAPPASRARGAGPEKAAEAATATA